MSERYTIRKEGNKTVVEREVDSGGCLYLIYFLPLIGLAGGAGYLGWTEVHPVAGIVSGVAIFGLGAWLLTIKPFRIIYLLLVAVAYGAVAYFGVIEMTEGDVIWGAAAAVVAVFVILGAHYMMVQKDDFE